MKLHDFYYNLPEELIAQHPSVKRDESRLLVLDRETGKIEHKVFKNIIEYLSPNDCLVINETRVIPARLYGRREEKEEVIEMLLLKDMGDKKWEVLVKPGKKCKIGTTILFEAENKAILKATVIEIKEDGNRVVELDYNGILNEILDKTKGKQLDFSVGRGDECIKIAMQPIKDKITGKYKIGILARDSVSGIGTVTYIDKEHNRFGALGHTVVKEDKRELKISDGIVYECNIVGVSKGVRGRAGELRGMFLSDKTLGTAEKLCSCGIFGEVAKDFDTDGLLKTVASSENACPGKAIIYSTINGVTQKSYDIEIVKVDKRNKENKNFVIKITDDELIEETGGIVQGMSGSPIVQNGYLIGAVTHVLVNDPTPGYGIFIENMLDAAA